jgi:hypothetical protein
MDLPPQLARLVVQRISNVRVLARFGFVSAMWFRQAYEVNDCTYAIYFVEQAIRDHERKMRCKICGGPARYGEQQECVKRSL